MVRKLALVEASVQPGGRLPAPEPLALVQAFVNTVDREHGPDLFDAREDVEAWAAFRGLDPPADLDAAREVREALRELLWANNASGPSDVTAAIAVLDRAAASLKPRFSPPRLSGPGALAAVLSAAFLAMADGSWERLKACPGDHCGWAFYDRSANASATWCSMRICGNRSKTRAYYSRRL
jgi:predicted RNA-binding Zn ribbon-like protein